MHALSDKEAVDLTQGYQAKFGIKDGSRYSDKTDPLIPFQNGPL